MLFDTTEVSEDYYRTKDSVRKPGVKSGKERCSVYGHQKLRTANGAAIHRQSAFLKAKTKTIYRSLSILITWGWGRSPKKVKFSNIFWREIPQFSWAISFNFVDRNQKNTNFVSSYEIRRNHKNPTLEWILTLSLLWVDCITNFRHLAEVELFTNCWALLES